MKPSKATETFGELFSEGFSQGILAKVNAISQAAKDLASAGVNELSQFTDMFGTNQHLALESTAGQQVIVYQHNVQGAVDVKGYTDRGEYLGKHTEVVKQLDFEKLLNYKKR